jgi:AcrR family transcriptional regulator
MGTTTKEMLLTQARRLFWSRGFSNVSVRQIASAAGVDVALIARYFGSKLGLFEATLETLAKLDPDEFPTAVALVDLIVEMFANAPYGGVEASPISLILLNASDEKVGQLVIDRQIECWQKTLEIIIGSKSRAALFFAAILGFSIAQKTLHMDGISTPGSDEHREQLRHMLETALASPDF